MPSVNYDIAPAKPSEPLVRVSVPLFFLACAVSGMMVGTGLGRGMTLDPWWFLLAAAGLVMNVYGFVLRFQTRRIETYEAVEEIIAELRLAQSSAEALRKANGTRE